MFKQFVTTDGATLINIDEIVSKSLLNCHCKGLHSVMLLESPGKTIRLYVADKDHELWKNGLEGIQSKQMTIGYHAHHCNITIECVQGEVVNDEIIEHIDGNWLFDKYMYQSAIRNGKGGFEKLGKSTFKQGALKVLKKDRSAYLPAQSIHTVFVNRGCDAAWLVYEGLENDNYVPYCYSTKELESETFDGLYLKPTENDIKILLKQSRLI